MYKKSEQWLRKLKFIAEVKKGCFPNAFTFAAKIRDSEGEIGQPFGCTPRTIARDIDDLIKVHQAPLKYDYQNKGYYLTQPDWEFQHPVFQGGFISMAMLGTQLSANMLPHPLRGDMEKALAEALSGQQDEFFDLAMMESILSGSGIKACIDPEVFKKAFDTWRCKLTVRFQYCDKAGKRGRVTLQPHIMAFNNGTWYLKGYKMPAREVKVYAVQRVSALKILDEPFETDAKLLADTRKHGLFTYPKIPGIRLRCDAEIAYYIHEQQKRWRSKVIPQADGAVIVHLQPTIEHEVVRWVLAEAGKIQVLSPAPLRAKIAAAGRAIAAANG